MASTRSEAVRQLWRGWREAARANPNETPEDVRASSPSHERRLLTALRTSRSRPTPSTLRERDEQELGVTATTGVSAEQNDQ
jgi:hypothetical protein